MIIDFGAKNFFSFKEGFDISFAFGGNCPEIISQGNYLSNVLCVKGANGSGKTNILKCIDFISRFISDSFSNKPNGLLQFDPFFESKEPTEFYVSFFIKNLTYRYEAILDENKVYSEMLYRKDKREIKVFERKEDKVTFAIKEFHDLTLMPKLRKNVSLLSMAKQFEINCAKPFIDFFSGIITNVNYRGLMPDFGNFETLDEFLYEYEDYFDFVKNILIKFDPGISDIYISKTNEDGKSKYTPWFVFDINGEEDILPLDLQSSGTKSLYRQLGSYKAVLDSGSLLVLDEFDINLHPHILPHLLQMFLDPDVNSNNAQLIFTTHNTEIMDTLGRYRTYLVNKDRIESFCYRLDEIPGDILRNDRSISLPYNQGKIGGIPKV